MILKAKKELLLTLQNQGPTITIKDKLYHIKWDL